ncbi:MAG: hypothetical protein HDR28_00460 [Lachnospiraceae bacterium]|nr:hypothetical protein [Lachnospiraceae bacterium]
MLETKELEKIIKSRILSVFPDFDFELEQINFGLGPNNYPGTIFIYTQDDKYQYISIGDRGKQTHKEFTSEDDVLYAILNSFIFRMALDYEKEHREPGKDFRRIYFAKQIELYSKFGKEFEERKIAQINEILRKAPYHDEE